MASRFIQSGVMVIQIGHVCSKCSSVVLQTVQLQLKGSVPQIFGKRGAEEAFEKARDFAIRDIKMCYEHPRKMGNWVFESDEFAFSGNSDYCLSDIDNECPCCGHVEPWQEGDTLGKKMTSRKELNGISQENRPLLITSAEERQAWVDTNLERIFIRQKQYWEMNPQKAMEITQKVREVEEQIQSYGVEAKELDNRYSTLASERKKLEEEIKAYSMFSAERKQAKARYKAKSKEADAAFSARVSRNNQISAERRACEKELAALRAAGCGITGKLRTFEVSNEHRKHQAFWFE